MVILYTISVAYRGGRPYTSEYYVWPVVRLFCQTSYCFPSSSVQIINFQSEIILLRVKFSFTFRYFYSDVNFLSNFLLFTNLNLQWKILLFVVNFTCTFKYFYLYVICYQTSYCLPSSSNQVVELDGKSDTFECKLYLVTR